MKTICSFFTYCLFLINQLVIGQSGDGNIIRLKADFENAGSVKMSDLVSEIRYLPLETNSNCLIGYMNVPVFGKDILINSNDNSMSLYRFSNEGKFLNTIGKMGRGPGEYQDRTDVQLIGNIVYVVSNFSRSIICYSLNGDFLRKYQLNIEAYPKSIVQLKDKSFLISFSNPSNLGSLIKTDQDFNIESGFIKNVPLDNNPLPFRFQQSRDQIFYYYNYLDTVFDLSKGYPDPAIIIDYGKYRQSKKKVSIYKKNNDVLNRPSISDFTANNEYMMFSLYYPFLEKSYYILHNISDGSQKRWIKLINDLDCGTFDNWYGYLVEKSSIIFILKPPAILKKFESMTSAEKTDPKNIQFVNMASKITLQSNPVIMICKLR